MAEQELLGEDRELAVQAAAGDRDSFATLYQRHFDRVYDFSLRLMRNSDEAADVTQETFLKAIERLDTLREPERFKPWLFSIAHNLAINRIGRIKRTSTSVDTADYELSPVYCQIDTDRLADPEAAAEDRELASLVWQAAAGLERQQYAVLDLHLRQGLDSAEIAEALSVSKGNAYVMLNRVKKAVEEALTAYIMAWRGRRQCQELDRILAGLQFQRMTPDVRKAVSKHVASCPTCSDRKRQLVSPLAILSVLAPVPAPLGLRDMIFQEVAASWGHPGGDLAAQPDPHATEDLPGGNGHGTGATIRQELTSGPAKAAGVNTGLLAGTGLAMLSVVAVVVFLLRGAPADTVVRDPADVRSTSHVIGEASSSNLVTIVWSAQQRVKGYSVLWSRQPRDLPDAVPGLPGNATGATSGPLTPGEWYFHLRTQGESGRWTSTVHLGAFVISGDKTPSPTAGPLSTATSTPALPDTTVNSASPSPSPPVSNTANSQPHTTATLAVSSDTPAPEPTWTPVTQLTPRPTHATTPTPAATETPSSAPSPTPTPAPTEMPTETPTETPTQTPTETPSPTVTPTSTPVPMADLVITGLSVQDTGLCDPYVEVYRFSVTVANRGTATSPAIAGKAMVSVMDQDGSAWGNGVDVGAIRPGAKRTVVISIFYLVSDPAHMTRAAPHPFQATVDPLGLVDELDEGNNYSRVVGAPAPRGCTAVDGVSQIRESVRFRTHACLTGEGQAMAISDGYFQAAGGPGTVVRGRSSRALK